MATVAHEARITLAPRHFDSGMRLPRAWSVLHVCLEQLPEHLRMMLWLSDIEQRPIEDAATVAGIAESLAVARLTRARLMLAKALCHQVTSVGAGHRTSGMSTLLAPSTPIVVPLAGTHGRKAARL